MIPPGTTARADLQGAFAERGPQSELAIAMKIFPPMNADAETVEFSKIAASTFNTDPGEGIKRKVGGKVARRHSSFTNDSARLEEYQLQEGIDSTQNRFYQRRFSLEQVAMRAVADVLTLRNEIECVSIVHNTTTYPLTGTTGLAVGTEWSNKANADPVADINVAKSNIITRHGPGPFHLQINDRQHRALSNSAAILENLKYTGRPPAELPLDMLADALGVDEIHVGQQAMVTNPGPNEVQTRVWSDEYAFVYRPHTGAEPEEGSGLGRTFVMDMDDGPATYSFDDPDYDQVVVGAKMLMVKKVIYPTAGFLLGNIIAT